MQIRFASLIVVLTALSSFSLQAQTTWLVNNLTNIGGFPVTKLGNPQVISTPYGNAVQFNGINDGLIVSNNPLAGMTRLTVEFIFKHFPLTVPSAWQPRFVHVQSLGSSSADHRLTLETRVITNTTPHRFLLDTFLKFTSAAGYSLTLSNAGFLHPVDEWTHMAVTYDGTNFRNYVNGRLEYSGTMNGMTFTNNGSTWIGQRSNNTNYFEGAALALRFTSRVLPTNEFMNVPRTVLSSPVLSNSEVQLNFALTSGLPADFKLLQADQVTGPWSTNAAAVLETNSPGVSFRFTATLGGESEFYRVQSP